MIRAKCLAAAALLSTSLSALAVDVDTNTTYTFESVSKISFLRLTMTEITGVLVNDSVPSTLSIPFDYTRCDPLYSEMMKNPGQYILGVTIRVTTYPNEPGRPSYTTLADCSLQAKP